MKPRRIMLPALAIILVGLALWVNLRSPSGAVLPPPLTTEELGQLLPTAQGDQRLLESLRRQATGYPDGWKGLPAAARACYITLTAEDVHRNGSWAAMTEVEPEDNTGPTLQETAAAYATLGLPDMAGKTGALAERFDEDRKALLAWVEDMKAGRRRPRPPLKELGQLAGRAFGHLDQTRDVRLKYAREHAAELAVR